MSLNRVFTKKFGKRMLAGIMSAALIMTSSGMIPAKAEEEPVVVTTTFTEDKQVRQNNTAQPANGASIEFYTHKDNNSVFAGLYKIGNLDTTRKIESISIQFTNQSNVKDTLTAYPFDNDWTEEETQYADVEEQINATILGNNIGTMETNHGGKKLFEYGEAYDAETLAKHQTTLELALTDDEKENNDGTLSFYLKSDRSNTNGAQLLTKDVSEDTYSTNDTNRNRWAEIMKVVEAAGKTAKDVQPVVTITYGEQKTTPVNPSEVTTTFAEDKQVRQNNTNQSATGASIEYRIASDGNVFAGLYKIGDLDTTKKLESISIRFTNQMNVRDTLTAYPFGNDWSETTTQYADVAEQITEALTKDNIGTMEIGYGSKKLFEYGEACDAETLAKHQATLDLVLTDEMKENNNSSFSFYLHPSKTGNNGTQLMTKDASEDTYSTNDTNRNRWAEIMKVVEAAGKTAEDLKPVVIITYGEDKTAADVRAAAIAELEAYKATIEYSETGAANVAAAKENGKTAINAATTAAEVATALAEAKAAIDVIPTKAEEEAGSALQTAKNNAIAELNAYVPYGMTEADYNEDVLSAARTEAASLIEAAATEKDVKNALTAAKVAVCRAESKNVRPMEAADTNDYSNVTTTTDVADVQFSDSLYSNATGATSEVRLNQAVNDPSKQAMGIRFAGIDTTKKVESATLTLTGAFARVGKDTYKVGVSKFDEDWSETASALSQNFVNKINEKIASPDIAGQTFKNGKNGSLNDSKDNVLADWQTVIDVTSLVADSKSNVVSLLVTPDASNGNNQIAYFTKDLDNTYANYANLEAIAEAAGVSVDALKPTLTINYKKEVLDPNADAFYNLYFGDVNVENGAEEIILPIYFDRIYEEHSQHAVKSLGFRVYFDTTALTIDELEVPRGSLGKEQNVAPRHTEARVDEYGTYVEIGATMAGGRFNSDTVSGGLVMNLIFIPTEQTDDNTKYVISGKGKPLYKYDANGNIDDTVPYGYATFTEGSITFGTPVVEKTALEKVNEAADAAALKAVVEDTANAEELKLDLTKYNTLNDKDAVMANVLTQKPYETAEAFKKAFDAAVDAQYLVENPPVYEYALGDVKHDGTITIEDALLALQISVGAKTVEPTSWEFLSADLNGDGTVDTDEVLAILQKANGKTVEGVNWLGKR